MELSVSNIKKFLKLREMETLKRFLIFREMKVSSSALILRNFYIFLKESFSYISGNRNTENNSLYFSKRSIFMFQETETRKNYLYFSNKTFLYFKE